MTEDQYACLKLENQVCFPLYACAKEIVRRYRPMLDELDITYTQYIAMMVLWEQGSSSVNSLGDRLFLDSGTLSPMLKNLEAKGYVTRNRSKEDERTLIVSVTPKGMELRDRALSVPGKIATCVNLSPEKGKLLYDLLYEILGQLSAEEKK
ncbi:MAG: MarR family transcriptional regulator [Candidatus Methanomethylophilaceae archaeon]|nr:MarR family transcriptional regulator [Candidatus Methanomethylophilaceae archaeon]